MSTTPRNSPPRATAGVPYFFANTFNQLPPLCTSPTAGSPVHVEPSSTPVCESKQSITKNFVDFDGEADLSDGDSDNPDLPPREKLSFGGFTKTPSMCVKGKENVRRFRPVTPKKIQAKWHLSSEVTKKEDSGKRIWRSGFTPTKTVPEPKIAVDMTACVVERGMWDTGRLMRIINRPRPKMANLEAGEGCHWKGVVVNGGHVKDAGDAE